MLKKPQATAATLQEIMLHNAHRATMGQLVKRGPDKARPIEIIVTLAAVVAGVSKLYLMSH